MRAALLLACVSLSSLYRDVFCKVFERCELVRELSAPRHRIPQKELATWVCIAEHESQYNTSAVGHLNADLSGDHGLFQISDQYWCSPPGVGLACGLNCDQLEDDDIKDDVICARRIYRAHKRRTGDGFTAWAVYGPHCRGDVSRYLQDCDAEDVPSSTAPVASRTSTSTTENPDSVLTSTTNDFVDQLTSTSDAPTTQVANNNPSSESTKSSFSTPPPTSLFGTSISTVKNGARFFHSSTQSSLNQKPLYILTSRKPYTFNYAIAPEIPVSTSRAKSISRTYQTSSVENQRPTVLNAGEDSNSAAWLRIHLDPRFLDEFP